MNTEIKPLVSVCIITYNHEKYIQQCLLSVLNQQTDFEFEIIVSDDYSTDRTASIVRDVSLKHPGRIKEFLRKDNIGGVKNYLETHHSASGHYIAHLDGDDQWLPGKLSEQVEFFKNNPQCSAVYSNAVVVDHLERGLGKFNGKLPSLLQRDFLLKKGSFLTASSFFYKRSLINEVIPSDREFIDYQVNLRCSQFGEIGYLNRPLVIYRIHAAGITSKSASKLLELYWIALSEAFDHDGITPSIRSAVIDFMATVFCRAIIERDSSMAKQWVSTIHQETQIHCLGLIALGSLQAVFKIINSIKKRTLRILRIPHIFANR